MKKQMLLPLGGVDDQEQEQANRLWEQLPDQDQIELIALYASLIAEAARRAPPSQRQERRHEAEQE